MNNFQRLVADDPDVAVLFDTSEIDHVCRLVHNNPQAVADGIRAYLLEPLQRVVESLYRDGKNSANSDFQQSALALLESATNVCRIIDLNPVRCTESATELSEILSTKWREFALQGTASSLWHDLPKKSKQNKKAASVERPNARSPFKQAIKAAMRPYKRDFVAFKVFMQSWEKNPIKGLSIEPQGDGKGYVVTDEDGDLGAHPYAYTSLQKMYAEI